jgi:hypothetical protein
MSLLSATPKQAVLSRINALNALPVPLTTDELYLGHPRAAPDGINTIVPTTAQLGGDYVGYRDLTYKRINLTTLFDERPVIKALGAPTLVQMLPVINKWLGLDLTADDVIDAPLSLGSGEQVNIQVKAQPNSYGYTGSFIIQYYRTRPYLVWVVRKMTALDVLVPDTGAQTGKQSVTMALWNEDFTNYVADGTLKVNAANTYWANLTQMKALMDEYGYANWPTPAINGVTDFATNKVPTANQNYDRVIIQKAVVGDTYAGDAYFHYNLVT